MERFEQRTLLSVSVVSLNAAGTAPGNSESDLWNPNPGGAPPAQGGILSADGKFLVFESQATDLVNSVNDTNHASDVFVRDLATNTTTLVSVTPDGTATGDGASSEPAISPDGRYVAFVSQADNLTAISPTQAGGVYGPSSGTYLYVRDLQTGTTTLLDATPDGKAADGSSSGTFVFSPDSKSLAFVDSSDDLTNTPVAARAPAPGTGEYVYVRDLEGQSTALVSVSADGKASSIEGDSGEFGGVNLVFSPDGRQLVFSSAATDLTTDPLDNSPGKGGEGGDPLVSNLFLRDLASGTTTLISATKDGRLGVDDNTAPVFSPDGRLVAFLSTATNLTGNPAPAAQGGSSPGIPTAPYGPTNLFVRDLSAQTTTLVSATPAGAYSSGSVSNVVFSPDGRSLAFVSGASDLTSNPADPTPAPLSPTIPYAIGSTSNVFVRDLNAQTTALVSVTPGGMLSNGYVNEVHYSPDGHSLAFVSTATDLTDDPTDQGPALTPDPAPGDPATIATVTAGPSSYGNLFIRDLTAGTTTPITVTPDNKLSNGNASNLVYSSDGRSLFFESTATDLTENAPDLSNTANVPYTMPGFSTNLFVRDLSAGTTTALSVTPDGKLSTSSVGAVQLAPDGQTIYYSESDPSPLNPGGDIDAATAPFAAPDQVHFASWQFNADESSGSATITVVRSAPLDAPASVVYAVQDDTATSAADYTATSGTLHFAAGQAAQTFSIPLNPADQFDGTKSANLVLSNASGAGLGVSNAVLTLTSGPATPVTTPAPVAITSPTSTPIATATPTPSSTPVATATPAPGTSTPVADQFGPFVLGVTPHAAHRAVASLEISFTKPLNAASASNPANYHVNLLGHVPPARHGHVKARSVPGRAIAVTGVVYSPATNGVTLTLGPGLKASQAFQLAIKGTPGGLTDAASNALQSRGKAEPGQDYVITLDQAPTRR